MVFTCKTLVVIKLVYVAPKNISFVDLPLLKILHLNSIGLSGCVDLLQQFFSGSLNLEDLKVINTLSYRNLEYVHSLPKLVRAEIDTFLVPLEIVKNVEVLVTNLVMPVKFVSCILFI